MRVSAELIPCVVERELTQCCKTTILQPKSNLKVICCSQIWGSPRLGLFTLRLISFRLCWASVAVRTFLWLRRSRTAPWLSGSASVLRGLSWGAQPLGHVGFCSCGACEIFPDQGSNQHLLLGRRSCQGSPPLSQFTAFRYPSLPQEPLRLCLEC